jgi:hypothetical protein
MLLRIHKYKTSFAINLPTYAQYFHHFIIYLHSPTCFGPLWTIIRALQGTKFTD